MGFFAKKVGIKVVAQKLLHSRFQLLVTGKIKDDVQLDRLEEIAIHRMGASGLSPTIHDLLHNNPLH
jgi:hypothetical protein